MATPEAFPETEFSGDEYGLLPIAVATLYASEHLEFDLYLLNDRPRLYRGRDYPLRCEDLDKLRDRGVRTLYVPSTDHVLYKRYVRENLEHYLKDEAIPVVRRYEMLQDAARQMIAESFQAGDTDEVLSGASEVANRIIHLVSDRQLVVFELLKVMYHDFNTFGHLFSVATYCLLLAKGIGIRNQQDLEHIAVGALLHDIGKLRVPAEILNKPGRLSQEERSIVRQHPQTGFCELCLREELSWGQLMMVYRHHERLDGGGYPVGLPGKDIHPWARLCSVADVYDAVTCHRPYRRRMSPPEVREYLNAEAGAGLDKEIVQCWNAILKAERLSI